MILPVIWWLQSLGETVIKRKSNPNDSYGDVYSKKKVIWESGENLK
jgi:hypothetical protein